MARSVCLLLIVCASLALRLGSSNTGTIRGVGPCFGSLALPPLRLRGGSKRRDSESAKERKGERKKGKLKDQPFRRIPGYVKYKEEDAGSKFTQDPITGEWDGKKSHEQEWLDKKAIKQKNKEIQKSQKLKQMKNNKTPW